MDHNAIEIGDQLIKIVLNFESCVNAELIECEVAIKATLPNALQSFKPNNTFVFSGFNEALLDVPLNP
jgi:hypothetical protein